MQCDHESFDQSHLCFEDPCGSERFHESRQTDQLGMEHNLLALLVQLRNLGDHWHR
jgi:hypothetical protein